MIQLVTGLSPHLWGTSAVSLARFIFIGLSPCVRGTQRTSMRHGILSGLSPRDAGEAERLIILST